jgi:putative oxidoreductase
MKLLSPSRIIRFALIVVLLTHSLPSMLTGDVNNFGKLYLDEAGFAPFGLVIAWLIKLSHIACAVSLVVNRFVKPLALITILILVAGAIMVHWPNGWFVVGNGRNGMEYNFVLVCMLLAVLVEKPAHS